MGNIVGDDARVRTRGVDGDSHARKIHETGTDLVSGWGSREEY